MYRVVTLIEVPDTYCRCGVNYYIELAEAFSHFSIEKSGGNWAALNIKGVGTTLIDPSLALAKPD